MLSEQELMDEFIETTSFDEPRDWRLRQDLDEDDDEFRSLAARDERVENAAAAEVEAVLERMLPTILEDVATEASSMAMVRAGTRFLADGEFKIKLDARNPAVIEWAKEHSAELIAQVTASVRDRIRLAIEELQEDGDFDFAKDRILAAVGDEARATLIARHETMLAAGEGQRLGWQEAEQDGLLTGKERREWIITDDERTCPICTELAGTTATLNGSYPGGIDGPPAHVLCRCTEGIVG